MKTSSTNYMKTLIVSLMCLCLSGSLAAQTVVFSDDFSRDDGEVGNGWTITKSSGNGQSGAGLPIATISGKQLELKRNGWGNDAGITLQQNLTSKAMELSVDLLNPSMTGGTAGGSNALGFAISDSTTGAHIRVSLFNLNTDGLFRVQIETSTTSGWGGWSYYYPSSAPTANPGKVIVEFELIEDGKYSILIKNKDTSTVLASPTITNTALSSGFDCIQIFGDWTKWTSPAVALSIDNIVAKKHPSIPEPASIALLLAGILATVTFAIRRRNIRA